MGYNSKVKGGKKQHNLNVTERFCLCAKDILHQEEVLDAAAVLGCAVGLT